MIKEKTIKHAGLDFKFVIDSSEFVEKLKDQYKPVIENLRKLLDKRDEYICKMHQMTKGTDVTMFLFANGLRVAKKASKLYGYNEKQYMALSYLNNTNMCKIEYLNKHLIGIGYRSLYKQELDKLVDNGCAIRVNNYYCSITDKGKQVIKSIYVAYRQDIDFFIKNKKPTRRTSISGKTNKYSEEERERRGNFYRLMMRPFWDGGYKVIPKDKDMRVTYLLDWIKQKQKEGQVVDDMYMRLVERWAAVKSFANL